MSSTEDDFMRMLFDMFSDDPATGYYQKFSTGSYDPNTGENIQTMTEIPVQIILQDLTRNSNGLSYDFGTDIVAGDKNCYVLPPNKVDSSQPQLMIDTVADRLRVGTLVYRVENMKSTDPTGSNPILYQLMLRR